VIKQWLEITSMSW